MGLKFKIYHNKKWIDITQHISDVEWSDSLDSLGMSFSFKYPYNRLDPKFNTRFFLGDRFLIKSGKNEIMRGIITQRSLNAGEYSGFDLAFYLNKSEAIIQFKKISASKAIRRLCEIYSVPIGNIPKMSTAIKKIYKDKTIADIIKDILSKVKAETGKGHRVEMNRGKLSIMPTSFYKIDPYFYENGKRIRCTSTLKASGDVSIEELKNKVIVAGNNEKKKQIKATVSSTKSIRRYGLLTEVVTGDKMNASKARNIAKNKLQALNRVKKNISLEMVGNPYIKAGRRIFINRPDAGLRKGYYGIKSVSHHYSNGIHKVTVELR